MFCSYIMIELKNGANLGEWFCSEYKPVAIFICVRKSNGFKHTMVFSFFTYLHALRNTQVFLTLSNLFYINCSNYLEELYVQFFKICDWFYIIGFVDFSAHSVFVTWWFNLDHMFWASFHVSKSRSTLSFLMIA